MALVHKYAPYEVLPLVDVAEAATVLAKRK
jgi:hypothetical protein